MSNVVIRVSQTQDEVPVPLYWVPHDKCRNNYDESDWRYNSAQTGKPRKVTLINNIPKPEVYRLDPEHSFKLPTDYMRLLIDINPELLPDRALGLLTAGLAFCNIQYGVFDQPRFMGGATVTGDVDGNRLWLKTLNASHPAPNAQAVLADQTLWFWCVSVTSTNRINYWMRKGKDGNLHKCRMFLIADEPVYVQLDELKRVDSIQDAQVML